MKKTATIALSFGLCVVWTVSASAALVLSLDARAPGASPSTQWADISGNNLPFTVSAGAPTHNAGPGTYSFGGGDQFIGNAANEALYDFDTAIGTGADPYTVVFYASIVGNQGKAGMLNKLDTAGANATGWHVGLSQDEFGLNNVFTEQRVQNGNRAIIRTPGSAADPAPNTLSGIGVTANLLNLYVLHISGTGSGSAQADVYINGSLAEAVERVFPFETMNSGSVLNDDPLRLGGQNGHIAQGQAFKGDIQFLEIYSGVTIDNNLGAGLSPADYGALRFSNLGVLVVPEPATLLLGLFGAAVLWIRRRRG